MSPKDGPLIRFKVESTRPLTEPEPFPPYLFPHLEMGPMIVSAPRESQRAVTKSGAQLRAGTLLRTIYGFVCLFF